MGLLLHCFHSRSRLDVDVHRRPRSKAEVSHGLSRPPFISSHAWWHGQYGTARARLCESKKRHVLCMRINHGTNEQHAMSLIHLPYAGRQLVWCGVR